METATPAKVAVELDPVPGFCVKSRATDDALVHLTAAPSDQPGEVAVKRDSKIFVNIAWDPNVPPPPPGGDDAIRRAVHGLVDEANPEDWFVPIVLSDARQDLDRAGRPAIVFDCILHPSIKSRCLKNPDFKDFIIELAFQRIEVQTTLVLSRRIVTPNIASKGRLRSRRVLMDAALHPPDHPNHQSPAPLIQEIPERSTAASNAVQPKSILKKSQTRVPAWSWTRQGFSIRIVFDVPGVTHADIPASTLDVEPRRILLCVPGLYGLDLNLEASDSELVSVFGKNDTTDQAVKLRRIRSFDVDSAKAEWHVADRTIVLLV